MKVLGGLLAPMSSVPVHMVATEVVVVDSNRLLATIDHRKQGYRIPLYRATRIAESDDHASGDVNVHNRLVRHVDTIAPIV